MAEINNQWDYPCGVAAPPIEIAGSNSGGYIQMSIPGRPVGLGYARSASEIVVTFPDDATYVGELVSGNRVGADHIYWSNNSCWEGFFAT